MMGRVLISFSVFMVRITPSALHKTHPNKGLQILTEKTLRSNRDKEITPAPFGLEIWFLEW